MSPALLDLVLPPFSQRCRLRPVLLPSHPPGLYAYRWEQLVANRDKFDLIEALTWNDYGEVCLPPLVLGPPPRAAADAERPLPARQSSYIGPIAGAQPNSQAWVDGFDHTALLAITAYYSQAFRTGVYPAIEQDKIYLMARPHPVFATAYADPVGPPTGREYVRRPAPSLGLLFVSRD